MTVDPADPYAVLGLTPKATQGQIRRAYLTLLRRHHPDTRVRGNPDDNAASDRTLQQVIAAYALLGDPARRTGLDHPIGAPQTTSPTPVRPRMPIPRTAPDQPPIQAGPVRWHGSRS